MVPVTDHTQQEAHQRILVQDALNKLCLRYDPLLVLAVVTDWADYMNRQLVTMARQRAESDGVE